MKQLHLWNFLFSFLLLIAIGVLTYSYFQLEKKVEKLESPLKLNLVRTKTVEGPNGEPILTQEPFVQFMEKDSIDVALVDAIFTLDRELKAVKNEWNQIRSEEE